MYMIGELYQINAMHGIWSAESARVSRKLDAESTETDDFTYYSLLY